MDSFLASNARQSAMKAANPFSVNTGSFTTLSQQHKAAHTMTHAAWSSHEPSSSVVKEKRKRKDYASQRCVWTERCLLLAWNAALSSLQSARAIHSVLFDIAVTADATP
eukprot:1161033-Pelagomonas_calceolata.AAC.6